MSEVFKDSVRIFMALMGFEIYCEGFFFALRIRKLLKGDKEKWLCLPELI